MRQRLTGERGFTLLLALGALVTLTITVTALISYTSSNSRSSSTDRARQSAGALAEAGLNNAISILNATNAMSGTSIPSSKTSTSKQIYADGTAWWWGTLSGSTWSLHGLGEVRNPTGAANITHEITADVDVRTSLVQAYNTTGWDYIMSTHTGSACDQTISAGNNTGNPDTILSRLYVFGNLCIGTSSGGTGHINAGPLMVKGKILINESSSGVGTSAAPINELHVGQGCNYISRGLHTPCVYGSGTGKDNVFATAIDTVVPTVTAPTVDMAGWYTNANPGPKNACATSSGTPPTWDGNTVRDNSVATSFELTPATSYSCKNTWGTQTLGELSWNATTKTLTVAGTMFIDGSAKITNGALNQYNGQGTLYLSGTFYMSNGSKLCGGVSGANCDYATWNPNTELFGIVANGSGSPSPVPAGESIYLYNAQFQGAFFGTSDIRLEGTTQTSGPMVASEVELGYNVSTASASANGFPLINTVPVGLPGVPANTHALPQPPRNFKG